jgi:hypothetical protein
MLLLLFLCVCVFIEFLVLFDVYMVSILNLSNIQLLVNYVFVYHGLTIHSPEMFLQTMLLLLQTRFLIFATKLTKGMQILCYPIYLVIAAVFPIVWLL